VDQDAQTAELYDFLYRDAGRIASYYTQIFGGRLSSFERTLSENSSGERSGKIGLPLIGGEASSSQGRQSGSRTVFDAHEMVTTDVLAMLAKDKRLNEDIGGAPHGALVITQGTLVFIDKSMMEMALRGINLIAEHEIRKPEESRNLSVLNFTQILISVFGNFTIPSGFLLVTVRGLQVVGTIKDAGMEEPISSYYYKHGAHGLSNVHLVGIKEIPAPSFSLPDNLLFGAAQKGAEGLSEFFFPPTAVRVTPIAMFRKL
jgi:hypothetical protein